MSYSSSSVVRRTNVSSGSPLIDDGPIIPQRNYQVYRGMSPTTANRIEARVKELEELLESEREIHLRNERELAEVNAQLLALTDRADEAENQLIVEVDVNKKKDQELAKLRKDLELITISHETEVANLKRRHQELLNDLNDQLQRATKGKSKSEKDRQHISIEIENLNSSLENATREKNIAFSKLEDAEDQLRKLRNQVDELNKVVIDLKGGRDKLAHENAELQRQLHDFEMNSSNFAKSRSHLQVQLDEAKTKLEDQTARSTHMEIQFHDLQSEFDKLQGQLEEEVEAANSLRNQNQKLGADYTQLKSKYDRDVVMRTEEFEDLKRKLNARVNELEGLLEHERSKASKMEKDKNKFNLEIRDITLQLDEANAVANDCMKRMKQAEHQAMEWQKKFDELHLEFNSSKSDNDRHLLELARLKALCDDQHMKIDLLNREVHKLTEALKESESSNKDYNRTNQDLIAVKSQLLNERDTLLNELSDAKDTIRELENRLDSASGHMHSFKTEWETKLREKEEELEQQRRNGQRSTEEIRTTMIELENRLKTENGRLKKKYDADQQEFLIQIDALNRNNAEFAKNNKHLASRVKELELSLESELAAGADAKNSVSILERKVIGLTSEVDDLRALLDAAERARKNAENELHENSSRSQEINISINNLTNDKKRLESECQNLHRELHDAISSRKSAEDRMDGLQGEINRLSDLLRMEQDKAQFSESARKQLEVQINELNLRLGDNDSSREGRKLVEKLKLKIHELQSELDIEQRRERDATAELRKFHKQAQDNKMLYEEEHRLNGELQEQIKSLLGKINTLKRQVDESDEVLTITMGKYRKCQQQLEEAERRGDRAEQSISVVRHHTNILPKPVGMRSISVSRELTRNTRF